MRTPSPAGARAVLALAVLGLAASPAAARERAPRPTYELGAETVPGGDFAEVASRWDQLRPDEGERHAVVPVGWRVGYQGGERKMPIPAIDPETRARCMDFEYGAGRVDLVSPVFDLPAPGVYLLSVRVKSVVAPSATALRGVVRLMPAEGGDRRGPSEAQVETMLGTGPTRMRWSDRTALIQALPGHTRAEIHLIKNEGPTDFLVGGVSFRRIERVAPEVKLLLDEETGLSPVLYLPPAGPLELRAADAAGEPVPGAVEARAGLTPAPGRMWEAWAPVEAGEEEAAFAPVHLPAAGTDLFAQFRAAPGARAAAVELRVGPYEAEGAPPRVLFTRFENGDLTSAEDPARVVFPSAGTCMNGTMKPARAFALNASRGLQSDLERAAAIARAVESRARLTAGGPSLVGSHAPGVKEILEDCAKATPLHCQEWKPDLVATACACIGIACRAVSSRALGARVAGVEGTEIWSSEESRWYLLPAAMAAEATANAIKRANLTAVTAAEAAGVEVGVATDVRWGQRGWVSYHPASSPVPAVDDFTRLRLDAESIERPVAQTHVDLRVLPGGTILLSPSGAEADDYYTYRLGPLLEWEQVEEPPIVWKLVPGDNNLEVRTENALGARGTIVHLSVRLPRSPDPLDAIYEGLEAYAGDPHVHTGLGIYEILDPGNPLASGTPERAFETAKANGLDWAAVTDFASNIDDPRAVARRKETGRLLVNPDGSETLSEWEHLRAVVASADEPLRFTAFLGVEYDTDGHSQHAGTGTKIILLPDGDAERYCSPMVQNAGDCPTVEDAYRFARQRGGVMIAASPCAASGLRDTDWSRYDPVVALMEIFGGVCEEGPGGFVEVTSARGLPVGAAGGGASMTATAGLYDRTICWAEENTRGALLSAIKARRCFWSAAGSLDLAFAVNGAAMGGRAEAGDATSWSLRAKNRTGLDFRSVEILRDGKVIASAPCESASSCRLQGGIGEPAPGVYHAALVAQDGAHLAITSPVRVRRSGD